MVPDTDYFLGPISRKIVFGHIGYFLRFLIESKNYWRYSGKFQNLSIVSYSQVVDCTVGENPDLSNSSVILCLLRALHNFPSLKYFVIFKIAPQILLTIHEYVGWFPNFLDFTISACTLRLINLKKISLL